MGLKIIKFLKRLKIIKDTKGVKNYKILKKLKNYKKTQKEEIMDISKFELFEKALEKNLAKTINEIISSQKKVNSIAFITTDDFYGFYVAYNNIEENGEYDTAEWDGIYPDYLYDPLVEIVHNTEDIDFTKESDEKWEFAENIIFILGKQLKQVSDEIYKENNYRREDILYFATMSDGDYIYEMTDESLKVFNSQATIEKYKGIKLH